VPSLAAEGSAGTVEVAAFTQAAAVAPSVRGAADFLVSDMLAFLVVDLQEGARWLAPQEFSHRADLLIGILPGQLAPEMSLDLLDVRLFKAGN
jgi:hypothetical protein